MDKEGKEGKEGTVGGRRAPLALQLPEGYAAESGKCLPIGSLTASQRGGIVRRGEER